jgi:RimJ/RimL family protein N-acetyltransferase
VLKTDRLRLRPFDENDIDAYARLCADAEVMRYVGVGGKPLDRAAAWREMAFYVGHWKLRGFGMWAVEERGRIGLIGRLGFHQPEGWPGFELGWVLAREHWGRGLAAEAAVAAIRHGFTELKQPRIISLIHPENTRSIRLAERVGERLEGKTELRGQEVHVYAIDKRRWETAG